MYSFKKIKIEALFLCVVLFGLNNISAQNKDIEFKKCEAQYNQRINPVSFGSKKLEDLLLDKMNQVLKQRDRQILKEDTILKKSAVNQAKYMAEHDQKTDVQDNRSLETTGVRVSQYGGSQQATEIVTRCSLKKSNVCLSYNEICDILAISLFGSSRNASTLQDGGFTLIGIGSAIDDNEKRVYISIVLGNFKSHNDGAKLIGNLTMPYSTNTYGLKAYDKAECRKIDRARNLHYYQKNLEVEDNVIYYTTSNYKSLNKLIRESNDGLAVDILQKEQFTCNSENIIDYNLPNRGILTKKVYSSRLFKNNMVDTKKRRNRFALKTPIGTIPEGLTGDYELNLVFVKNKTFCKSIAPSFLVHSEGTYSRKVELLADTITRFSEVKYKPIPDSIERNIKIPFGVKKYEYNPEDIKPFLDMLNEPAFIIYDLSIKAYSSIEGDKEENNFLQQERANSIVSAIKSMQKDSISTNVVAATNWELFKRDIQKTKYRKVFDTLKLEQAQKYIKDSNLNKILEPVLQKHRYATIKIKAVHDIAGDNQQPYVLRDFKKAIDETDNDLALSIEKFIIRQIYNKKYDISALEKIDLPIQKEYAGMLMNKSYILLKNDRIDVEEFIEMVDTLYKVDEENEYIKFNYLLNKVNYADLNELVANNTTIQSEIDRLYYSTLKQKTIDGLNIRYQFKLINAADSILEDEKLREDCVKKIKEIVKIKQETLNNSIKLAEVFIENEDFEFARKSLESWVNRTYSERLIFTYVSLCSLKENTMHTDKFNLAMEKAAKINPKRYCDLFKKGGFSLLVLENKKVKEKYCKTCNN